MNIEAIRNARTLRAVRTARALCQPRDWPEAIALDEAARRREWEILERWDNIAVGVGCALVLGFLVLL